MLLIHVEFETSPGDRAQVLEALDSEIPTICVAPGCHTFQVRVSPDQSGTVTLLEEWIDASSFRAYKESPSFERLGAQLRPLMLKPPITRIYAPVDGLA